MCFKHMRVKCDCRLSPACMLEGTARALANATPGGLIAAAMAQRDSLAAPAE